MPVAHTTPTVSRDNKNISRHGQTPPPQRGDGPQGRLIGSENQIPTPSKMILLLLHFLLGNHAPFLCGYLEDLPGSP